MKTLRPYRLRRRTGFTLAEMLVVIVILGISSMVVIPLISNTGDLQATSAARQVISTLLFAQTASIAHQQKYQVVFDVANNLYEVQDEDGTVIADPYSAGGLYRVEFSKSSGLSKVRLTTVDFDGTATPNSTNVWFDRMGAPYCGDPDDNDAMTSGTISVMAGNETVTVTVEPVSGRIKI